MTISMQTGREGAIERDILARGVDADRTARPGVPMETRPRPLPGAELTPVFQRPVRGVTKRVELGNRLTPVFGTAQPPRGPGAFLRRAAYRIPEHRPRHWMLLLLADRADGAAARLSRPRTLFSLLAPLVAAGVVFAWLRRT